MDPLKLATSGHVTPVATRRATSALPVAVSGSMPVVEAPVPSSVESDMFRFPLFWR